MFTAAVPVFAEGKEREKNYQLILRAAPSSLRGTTLLVTACSFYRLTVNGHFVAFGPARTAKGYARVDELALDKYHREGGNELVLEVAGYYCDSLSTVKQPSFVVAELKKGDDVLLATGREGDFKGFFSCRRLQKAERFSGQRHFGEIWDFCEEQPYAEQYRARLVPCEAAPAYLSRRVPYPTYEVTDLAQYASAGRFAYDETRPCVENSYSNSLMACILHASWGQYGPDEAVALPYRWIQKQRQEKVRGRGELPLHLSEGEYVILDMERIYAGFLRFCATADAESEVVLGFSELCSPDEFAFTNINMQGVITCFLPAEQCVEFQSFEPYTCRMAILMVKRGGMTLSSFGMRSYEFDRVLIRPRIVRDPELKRIDEAAERTFAHNAVDLYTDCPSRERAGWLCDSFFTARAEFFLTGKTRIEDAFLENYRLYRNEGDTVDGVLPMCYPADFQMDKKFIPQWNLWYVLEVREYLSERNLAADREDFRASIYGIMRYLAEYENEDGLLERLPSWNFVEWSTANAWVQDVNYPTNFLYSEALYAVGALYGDVSMTQKAARVREKTRSLSFDGEVFVDHAVRDASGALNNQPHVSEAGQYYALLFGDVDPSLPMYARLREYVENNFASFDAGAREFVPVNAFIGLYLRICALMKLGEKEILKRDLKAFFGGMVESTGTLWEYKQHKGSYDHGFASLAAIAIHFVEN